MSLITSCPACGTMFRVVPDQLKISEGWVRCGHCSEVFDATAHLADESSVEPVRADEGARPMDLQSPPPSLADEPPAPVDVAPPRAAPSQAAPPLQPAQRADAAAPVQAAPAHALEAAAGSERSSTFGDSQSLEPSPLDTPFVFRPSDFATPDREVSVYPPAPQDVSEYPLDEEPGPPPDVSFVRQARRKAFWRRPFVRVLLALVALALAALLALQVAYVQRDRLALLQPQLRPALARMCDLLQCRIAPPRLIEAITIESSAFNRVRNDTYRLSFSVRNTARVQVAAPALELTVTDAQDQPIARRVLTPADLGARESVIGPAGEWAGAVGVVVTSADASRVTGYRLLAFYP